MDKNLILYYRTAQRFLFNTLVMDDISGFYLKLRNHRFFFRGTLAPFNDYSAAEICSNKFCTNSVLELFGIPVPKGIPICTEDYTEDQLEHLIQDLRFPLVIKPLSGAKGREVHCNIRNIDELKSAINRRIKSNSFLLVEEFHGNLKSYRVLVHKYRVIGVVYREAAHVVADGVHSIRELIELTNVTRAKTHEALAPILIDEECATCLEEQGMTLETIPKNTVKVKLGYTCNATRGGVFTSMGKRICKENSVLMCKIARILGMNLIGIDVECVDITIPMTKSGGVIIEVNARPSMVVHEKPVLGEPNLVTRKIMRSLIFKYPFSYLYELLNHKAVAIYFRSFILLMLIMGIYEVLV